MPTDNSTYWAIQDVNNSENTRPNLDAVLNFGTVDVTGFTGVTITFDYEADGFDGGDDMFYTATFDGTPQAEEQFVDGTGGTDASGTITINVPTGTANVSLQVRVDQNGGSDYGGWDNFKVSGNAATSDTRVFFASTSSSQAEGNSGTSTATAQLSIMNPSATTATTVTLATSGTADGSDVSATPTTVTFPAGSSADQTVTFTITGDTDPEPDETSTLTISTVSGGTNAASGTPDTFTLTITNDDAFPLVINELLADPDGTTGDANGDGTVDTSNDEFVEIVNTSDSAIDLGGYTLSDAVGLRHTFSSPTILPGGQSITVFGGGTPTNIPGLSTTASEGFLGLNNGGDTVTLADGSSTTVATVTYGGEGGNNESLAREPDFTGAFVAHSSITSNSVAFSPGRDNTDNSPLPVELTAFTATADGHAADLRWETASETNNTGFEVQMDGGNGFSRVDFVPGAGTTLEAQSYSLRVANLAAGSYRFRLKQIDLDGAFEFSPVVELAIGSTEPFALSAGPNPFRRSANVSLQVAVAQDVTVEVYDLLGRSVARLFDGAMDADQSRTFSVDGSSLAPGLYVVRATGERFTTTRQIVRLR